MLDSGAVSITRCHLNNMRNPIVDIRRSYDILSPQKMSSRQYEKSLCGYKTILWSYYLHNGISHTVMMTSLYWNSHSGISYIGKMTSLRWNRALLYLEHVVAWGMFPLQCFETSCKYDDKIIDTASKPVVCSRKSHVAGTCGTVGRTLMVSVTLFFNSSCVEVFWSNMNMRPSRKHSGKAALASVKMLWPALAYS